MKSRVQIKEEAKALIRTGRVSPILVSAIVIVVELVMSEIVSLLEYGSLSVTQMYDILQSGDLESMATMTTTSHPAAGFVSILVSLVTMVLAAGYYTYLMGIRRGQEMPYSSVLEGLDIAGKVIWCNILMSLKVFLWSLLFVFPGIIAAYRYRFAIYNIIENPQMTASEAIAASCRQTEGWKMELFVLDLSFIGWSFLVFLTGGILGIWYRPYFILSDLGYYEMCKGLITGSDSRDAETPNHNDTPWEF